MSTAPLPLTEVAGQKLNGEQTAYLDGFFSGLRERGFKFSDVMPNPAAQPSSAPDLSELIAEERIKRELHPLDAYDVLLDHAATNKAPDKEDLFRFKWNGLFYLTPNKEAFMARLRIPGGQLQTFQLREIARIAKELTTGYVQITTRSNLQIRLIEPKDAPELVRRIQGVGLHTRGAGADNIRNLTCNSTAGFDPHELVDTMPYVHQLAQLILNDRAFYNLPRKFNIALDGGGLIGSLEDTNDVGAKAVRVDAEQGGVKAGLYFRIALGGATGHKAFANDLGVLVKPTELVKAIAALVRVYIANGNRTDRKKARLKHLLETWTMEQYLVETEKLLGFQLLRAPADLQYAVRNSQSETPPHSHIGVYPQKERGFNYVGVALPVGQITPKQLLRLADLADNYARGEVRLTVWQNLIIPHVPDAFVETLKKALVKMGLDWKQSNASSGVISCTGNSYCKFAGANTKGHALALAKHLENKLELDQPINIHLTGCPNSCAQHYIGDIGLLGAKVKIEGESLEGYHVFVGGGFGANRAVGRQIFQGVLGSELNATIERMLRVFQKLRQGGESFQQFAGRHDVGKLQEIFAAED
jgi:ferredoxin-nitrite reductase